MSLPAHLVFEQGLHVGRTHGVWMTVGREGGAEKKVSWCPEEEGPNTRGIYSRGRVPGAHLSQEVSPEDVINTALAEAMSTLRLTRLTQDQPAGLAAVLRLQGLHKVVSEPSVKRQEACRDTWTERVLR